MHRHLINLFSTKKGARFSVAARATVSTLATIMIGFTYWIECKWLYHRRTLTGFVIIWHLYASFAFKFSKRFTRGLFKGHEFYKLFQYFKSTSAPENVLYRFKLQNQCEAEQYYPILDGVFIPRQILLKGSMEFNHWLTC